MYRFTWMVLAVWLSWTSWAIGQTSWTGDLPDISLHDASDSMLPLAPLAAPGNHSSPPAPVLKSTRSTGSSPQAVLFLVSDEEEAEDLPEPGKNGERSGDEAESKQPSEDQKKSEEKAEAEKKKEADAKKKKERDEAKAKKSAANQQKIADGEAAFNRSCVDCHDAERSFEKKKSKSGWLATIRRMSKMDGADVSESDFDAIATFLASRNAPGSAAGGGDSGNSSGAGGSSSDADETSDEGDAAESDEDDSADGAMDDVALDDAGGLVPGVSLGGTVSTIWRGGNDNLESPNFFPDIWLSGDWQPEGPLSGRVTTCTSCHSDRTNGSGFTFELVEASAKFDLLYKVKERRKELGCKDKCEWDASIKAGRLVVPFGAFAAMSHPGVYRTLTNPLMYAMGRQVNADGNRPPVLPMPYSDEGVNLNAKIPVYDEIYGTVDVYTVNGLQGFGNGIQFSPSRSYTDNNRLPAIGARATLGTGDARFGTSWMNGRMEPEGSDPLGYKLTGADFTWRYEQFFRAYVEYAKRENDTDFNIQQSAWGYVAEAEVMVWEDPNLHFLVRYDTLETRGRRDETSIDRYTWGMNTSLPGGSLLIFNHEHWNYEGDSLPDTDVVGLRWVVTF